MSTFFGTKLVESMVPDHAIIHKLVLTQDQAAVLLREGVVPCSQRAHQTLLDLKVAGLDVRLSLYF